jgi:hypothetical protein
VNYEALQMAVQHRVSHGLAFSLSYSHSKALGYQGADPYHTEQWYYGPVLTDRPNLLTWNFSYNLPSPSREKFVKGLLGGWTWAGTGVVTSGAPVTPTCSSTAAFPYSDPSETGVGTNSISGVRCEITGNINAVSKSFFNNFNTSAVSLAPIGTFGDAGVGILRQPSFWNFDTSLNKMIQIKERASLNVRFQAYNVFNHTEFNTIGSTFQWNAANVNLNTLTGQYTNTQDARILAMSARFVF